MIEYRPGRWLLSLVGLFTALAHWGADFGISHMYNGRWPPHAKFHNGQGLLLSTLLGLLTIFCVWRRRGVALDNLNAATVLGSAYYFTQMGSIFLPNTALTDPEFVGTTRLPFGLTGAQPIMDVVVLAMIAIAYALEFRWMRRHPAV